MTRRIEKQREREIHTDSGFEMLDGIFCVSLIPISIPTQACPNKCTHTHKLCLCVECDYTRRSIMKTNNRRNLCCATVFRIICLYIFYGLVSTFSCRLYIHVCPGHTKKQTHSLITITQRMIQKQKNKKTTHHNHAITCVWHAVDNTCATTVCCFCGYCESFVYQPQM